MEKYKIDSRLVSQRPWDALGLQPDEIDWINEESFFSTGDRNQVWDAVSALLVDYKKLFTNKTLLDSRKYRAMYRQGKALNEDQAKISNNPNGVVNDHVTSLENVLRGLIGV